jgi:selenocysteine lyase/cysteine desulfurase
MKALEDPRIVYLRRNVTGRDTWIETPFGRRRRLYFDYIASGLPFEPVEEIISERVLPHMANTHTTSSDSGRRMSAYVEQARRTISEAVGATGEDVVLFTGSGSTGAISKLIQAMGLRVPDQLMAVCGCRERLPSSCRPVVFRSRMEHHSNDISWRETLGVTRFVDCDGDGRIDWRDLERQLALPEVREVPLKIGTFSAASNVTGTVNDVDALSETMHDAGGRVFFDYAAGAPYLPVELHPAGGPGRRKDAVFISTHKFIGGPQTPGVLAASRSLFTNRVPVDPGGGTVLYTSPWDHRYLEDIEHREEGGTPPIVQIIRAGLVFQLKRSVGADLLTRAEHELCVLFLEELGDSPGIRILGNPASRGLAVFSLLLDDCRLEHNLAVRLLNDLYGIQTRAGCMCAGTYGHDLLDIAEGTSKRIRSALDEGDIWQKPGWVRVSLSPVTEPEDVVMLVRALKELAAGWREYAHLYRRMPWGEYGWAGNGFSEGEPDPLLLGVPD